MRRLAQIRLPFNWIELLVVPVTVSIMETQPIAIVLLFGTLLFTGSNANVPLEQSSILLLLLGLYWWGVIVKRVMQYRQSTKQAQLLSLLGLLFALVITVGTHWSPDKNLPVLFFAGILTLWLWQRSTQRAQRGLSDEQLFSSFKIGFSVLLAILISITVLHDTRYSALLSALTYALPIFFFSSLLTFSLNRLGITQRAYVHLSPGSSQADPTRGWLMLLIFLWLVLVASIILLQTATFQPVLTVFSLLWNTGSTFFSWLIPLLSLLFAQKQPINHGRKIIKLPPHIVQPAPQPYYNPFLAVIGMIVIGMAVLLLVLFILRQWSIRVHAGEDEVREGLSMRRVLKARRQKKLKRRKATFELEPLDPNSVRIRYREFLQAMTHRNNELERRPNETPTEYQARLLSQLDMAASSASKQEHNPSDAAILQTLTQAYIGERYGRKQVAKDQIAYLRTWVPRLVKRLRTRTPQP